MTQLLRNSVWEVSHPFEGHPEGRYRLLELYGEAGLVVLFDLKDSAQTMRPTPMSLAAFESAIEDGAVVQGEYELPSAKLLSYEELSESHKKRRDQKYLLIQELVDDPEFLKRLTSSGKSTEITDYAQKLGLKNNVPVYRALTDYWRYGQTPNAFNPNYPNCGGPGKQKQSTGVPRGRPKQQPVYSFQSRLTHTVTEKDKKNIRRTIKRFFIKGKTVKITKLYEKFLDKHYFNEVQLAKTERRAPDVPSVNQFRYWFKQLFDVVNDEKDRIGETRWDMNNRGMTSGVSEHVSAPGDCFEIDATVADVYVVSKYNRSHVLGRPVIYVVVDQASRMVVGLFVDIVYASWDAAKQALLNAFLPKKSFCEHYGIEIDEDDWPCHHMPRSLLCDRGEMIHSQPEEHSRPLGIKLDFASPTRADWKSVVERRFGIANDETIHELKGTTNGKPKTRMDPDPKESALHTVDEVFQILIKGFIKFNKHRFIDDLITPQLIEKDLEATPLNYWNNLVSRHLDSLTIVDEEQAKAELLRVGKAQITSRGIRVGDLFYSCDIAEKENWFAIARFQGESSIDARIDDSNSSEIYVRKDERSPLLRCYLLPREKLYADIHRADVVWLDEWKREKKETGSDLYGRVSHTRDVADMEKSALKDRKDSVGTYAKSPNKVKDLTKAREEEQRRTNSKIVSDVESEQNRQSPKKTETMYKLSLIEGVLNDDDS